MNSSKVTKIEFIDAGFISVLKSDGTKDLLSDLAEGIAARAGDGFSAEVLEGSTRFNALVHSDTPEAAKAEAEDKVLSIAVGV